MAKVVRIIGAGLAGSEAAWQLANRGLKVELYEMRPKKMTPAHSTDLFGELVCSNSLRANNLANAVGLLKEELRRLDSLVISCADKYQVPAGGALAVDRDKFSYAITESLFEHPNIEIKREEVCEINKDIPTIIATGPLTSDALASEIKKLTEEDYLYFFDAAAPIVTRDSLDFSKVFWASRYDKGDADYLNSLMSKAEYENFYEELIKAEVQPLKEFEDKSFFEGCMPVEAMAKRGAQTLLFGPLKPVGIVDPRNGKQGYAVVQLRKENQEGTLLNLVGFQTNLKWGEQKRVFALIPGLENAEFVRYGVMHRNTFINSPRLLKETNQMRDHENIFFAGQITGVEGYVESIASGLVASLNIYNKLNDKEEVIFPKETAIGGLMSYIVNASEDHFQPMNVNFGIMPALEERIRNKREKNLKISERSLQALEAFLKEKNI